MRRVTPIADRFWRRVAKTDNCWLWTGTRRSDGYGVIQRGRKGEGLVRVHRLSWELAGNVPPAVGMDLCHRCDIRNCVNPAHLFVGTRTDNMEDAVAKGRTCRGADRPQARLTEEVVRSIRARHASGDRVVDLAREVGVTPSGVYGVLSRRLWRHVA